MRLGKPPKGMGLLNAESLAVLYVALPNAIFLSSWIVAPLGPIAAAALLALVGWTLTDGASASPRSRASLWFLSVGAAAVWCVFAGLGHFLYANSDWWVRDAVLLDLVRDPWPVTYTIDGVETLLRAPVGFYLPAALVGKLFGVRAADLMILIWTTLGVALVFIFMLSDRPTVKVAIIRILIFVGFSGMDILPTLARDNPHHIGAMIEWWPRYMQYGSSTTQLFWGPNHALPGWIATAWLLSRDAKASMIRPGGLFVILTPIWAPLTALGLLPLVAAAVIRNVRVAGLSRVVFAVLDVRVVAIAAICALFVLPYLVAGGDKIPVGLISDIPFVGDDWVRRYFEFIFFEFLGLAALLVKKAPADPLIWVASAVLLTLPFFRFGPYNDLVMRGSIPALALLAIYLGRWLSTPYRFAADQGSRVLAGALLIVGAVTPFMEFARVFIVPPWAMNTRASLIDITRGPHYLTPVDQPWLNTFLAPSSR
jgi:hypothetical protein